MVVVSGKWVLAGEVFDVRSFDPVEAKAHHSVVHSMVVDTEAIGRAFKAQLSYTQLLRP